MQARQRLALTLGLSLALAFGAAGVVPPAPAMAATTSVKVVDWNIDGPTTSFAGARFDAVVNAIKTQNPDIIALQEVHDNDNRVGGIDQVTELARAFPGYQYVWARGDGNGTGGSAGNLLLSRYPLLERYTVKLPNEPGNGATCPNTVDHAGSSTCPVNRSFAGLKINVNGVDIRAYTSHFSVGTGTVGPHERAAQSSFVVSKLQSPPIPSAFVFAGDLNATPGDVDRPKFGGIGLRDAWTEAHPNVDSTGNTYIGPNPPARIDYQWVSPGFDVTDIRPVNPPTVGSSTVSDHKLLVSTLTVRDPTQAAGASSSEGWAGARRAGSAARLWVCDDKSNEYGVLGYLENADTGANLLRIPDDRFGDQCQGALTTVSASTPLRVTICRNRGGSPEACVRRLLHS
jgi:endonuclease/exonuclease/phosphatase family metal-dependent hydrolase